jgi:hypothetical protein
VCLSQNSLCLRQEDMLQLLSRIGMILYGEGRAAVDDSVYGICYTSITDNGRSDRTGSEVFWRRDHA